MSYNIPKVGDTMIALLRQHVEVLSINDDNTANVALIPTTELPSNAIVIMNDVPFRYLTTDDDD